MPLNLPLNHTAKQRRAIGRKIKQNFGEPLMTAEAVGEQMGISPSYVRKIEEEALYKLFMAVRRKCIETGAEPPALV